jgi:hypothetical protein
LKLFVLGPISPSLLPKLRDLTTVFSTVSFEPKNLCPRIADHADKSIEKERPIKELTKLMRGIRISKPVHHESNHNHINKIIT